MQPGGALSIINVLCALPSAHLFESIVGDIPVQTCMYWLSSEQENHKTAFSNFQWTQVGSRWHEC